MRPLIYSIVLLVVGVVQGYAASPAVDIEKVIEKSFDITSDGTLDIRNKYGNVTISDWDKNSIDIKVTITVKTGSQSKADEIFDRIDIQFNGSSDYVSAFTEIESKSNSWFSWGSWSSGNDYEIDYEVKMPKTLYLKLENKYGNAYLPDLDNGASVIMKYGNVVMRSIEGKVALDLGYGNADFGDLGNLTADIKYSNIKGSSTQNLNINSKYSSIKIGDVVNVKSETKYDNYVIERAGKITNFGKYDSWDLGEIESLSSETKYTDFVIDYLKKDLDIDQKYGAIRVRKLDCNSDAEVDLEVGFTEIDFDMDGCNDYEIEYEGRYTDLSLTRALDDSVIESGNDTSLNERIGSGKRKFDIEMEYGRLKMK
ncbi:hypothetical protein GCM10007940_31990 [Portibacter lacus]|uniref:Adhesin domain-containing protein n=2 Tax=Portibacter lacus TaxID=1099794 RepID=A0AA37WF88_9BACT|nr:hypothetical protein GCM10007940_31990 [Portibacter lacus]